MEEMFNINLSKKSPILYNFVAGVRYVLDMRACQVLRSALRWRDELPEAAEGREKEQQGKKNTCSFRAFVVSYG